MASQKSVTIFLIALLSLSVIPLTSLIPANTLTAVHNTQFVRANTIVSDNAAGAPFFAPGPDLGITNWTHNQIENPDLEYWVNPLSPLYWNTYRTPIRYTWVATEPPFNVSQGTYSAAQETKSTSTTTGWSNLYQYGIGADMRNLSFRFDWLVSLMPDENYDQFMVYMSFSDNHYLYYYLAGGKLLSYSNSTTHGYYRSFGTINTWHTFSRNITADYLAIPGFPGTIAPGLSLNYIYFYIQAGSSTGNILRSFFDDVWLQNDTTTYIGGSIRNGDVEAGILDPWYSSGNSFESHISQSAIPHTGAYSCNLTSTSNGNTSYSSLSQSLNIRLSSDNPGRFSLWWHLTQDQVLFYDYAIITMYFTNFTDAFRLYFIISHGGPNFFTNATWDKYYFVDGFNTTGSWQHLQVNIWDTLSSAYGCTDALLDSFYITTFVTNDNSHIELLVDDVQMISRTVTVGDFEDQRDPGSYVYGFDNSIYYDITVTDQGYGGGKAANASLAPYGSSYPAQYLHRRPLNSSRETYLDLMWRIEELAYGSIGFYIRFWSNRYLWYIIGTTDWATLVNSSTNCYFNATGSGTIGSWIQLHRDLVHDYEAGFGTLPDDEMWFIGLNAVTGNAELEVLFDDIYIYDDPAPRLANHQRTPSIPVYNSDVQVDIDAEDQDLDIVQLTYRVDYGSWNHLTMTPQSGNTYRTIIPVQPYFSFVEYYIKANDTWGMSTIGQDGLVYYSYQVTDRTPPDVTGITQFPSVPSYLDLVNVSADCVDEVEALAGAYIYYRVDGGTWYFSLMYYITGNTYRGQIIYNPWNSVVEYYINVTDAKGNIRIADNGGSYYSYTVADPIDPELLIVAPSEGQQVSGIVNLEAVGIDPGSGIDRIEFAIDGTPLGIDTSEPYQYSWDSTFVTNGDHTITYTVYDNAGNFITDSITITVLNVLPPPPIPGFPVEALIFGLAAALGMILVLRRRRQH